MSNQKLERRLDITCLGGLPMRTPMIGGGGESVHVLEPSPSSPLSSSPARVAVADVWRSAGRECGMRNDEQAETGGLPHRLSLKRGKERHSLLARTYRFPLAPFSRSKHSIPLSQLLLPNSTTVRIIGPVSTCCKLPSISISGISDSKTRPFDCRQPWSQVTRYSLLQHPCLVTLTAYLDSILGPFQSGRSPNTAPS
jgi:hypothetical protein